MALTRLVPSSVLDLARLMQTKRKAERKEQKLAKKAKEEEVPCSLLLAVLSVWCHPRGALSCVPYVCSTIHAALGSCSGGCLRLRVSPASPSPPQDGISPEWRKYLEEKAMYKIGIFDISLTISDVFLSVLPPDLPPDACCALASATCRLFGC